MQLFVIRHAAAVARSPSLPDASRPLTPKGRTRWKRAVRGLESQEITFDRIYHSPWLRAVETANALARLARETVVTGELVRRPTQALLDHLEGDRVALVGHQPWLGELVGLLLFGDPGAGARLMLKKGAVVWLEGEPRASGMRLLASLTPGVLRTLGR